jgi:hypothetical protein
MSNVTIYEDSFSGGSGITPFDGTPNLAAALRNAVDDLMELRTQMVALMVQLDTEGNLGGGYVTGFTPAALTLIKG